MKTTSFFIIVLSLIAFSFHSQAQNKLFINEFLAENESSVSDFEGERSAWVEIYNAEAFAVDLFGFYLSDQALALKWEINRNVLIPPGGHLLIFLSGKDTVVGTEMHTNFELKASGTPLFLAGPFAAIIDQTPAVALPADVSYARYPDGGEHFYFLAPPTPAAPNKKGSRQLLAPPIIGLSSGFYEGNTLLSMHCPQKEAEVIYTTNGQSPDSFNSQKYVQPLYLTDLETSDSIAYIKTSYLWEPPPAPAFTVKNIAAKCAVNGSRSQETSFRQYWVDRKPHQFPVFHIQTPHEALFGHRGIMVPGPHMQYPEDGWIDGGNYQRRGRDWEAPAFLTFIDTFGQAVLEQGVGLRIHGGATRRYPKKSLRLYTGRSRDAENRNFDYAFFPDINIRTFRRLILRQSGNDWGGPNHFWRPERGTLFRDALMQSLLDDFRIETQASLPSVLYLNGVYWGIYNLRERYDYHYFDQYYGIQEKELDLLSHTHLPALSEASTGDNVHYMNMIDTLLMKEHMDKKTLDALLDAGSLMDYYTANIYFANTDWPANNVRMWRFRQDSFHASGAYRPKDGRWRWALFDTDFGFGFVGNYEKRMLSFSLSEGKIPFTLPIIKTLEIPEYRQAFIVNFTDYLNHHFRPEKVKAQIKRFQDHYAPEIKENIRRWDAPASFEDWRHSVAILNTFAEKRPHYMRKDLQNFFQLGKIHEVILDVNDLTLGAVQVNRLPPATYTYPWNGMYFEDFPIRLVAQAFVDGSFLHWENEKGEIIGKTDTLWLTLNKERYIQAVFDKSKAIENSSPSLPWAKAHPLAKNNYTFSEWSKNQSTNTFPPSMNLLQVPAAFDLHDKEVLQNWALAYDHSAGSRFEGMEEKGLAIKISPNRLPFEKSGYPVAVSVAVNTHHIENAHLRIDLSALSMGHDAYEINLKYRIGKKGPFLPLHKSGVEKLRFLPRRAGEKACFELELPPFLLNHSYVQIALHVNARGVKPGDSPLFLLENWRITAFNNQFKEDKAVDEKEKYEVYPNPSSGKFRIKALEATDKNAKTLQVFDLKGRLQESQNFYFFGQTSNVIDFSHLNPGLYLLRMVTEGGEVHVLKLVVVNEK